MPDTLGTAVTGPSSVETPADDFTGDWLIDGTGASAKLYRTDDDHLVLSNGIVARNFTLAPTGPRWDSIFCPGTNPSSGRYGRRLR